MGIAKKAAKDGQSLCGCWRWKVFEDHIFVLLLLWVLLLPSPCPLLGEIGFWFQRPGINLSEVGHIATRDIHAANRADAVLKQLHPYDTEDVLALLALACLLLLLLLLCCCW
jgi:hypothetical protein